MCVRARMRVHEVKKGQVPNFSTIGKLTISQPRRGLFEVCKSLKPSSRPAPGERTTNRNLLSSTTPFGGYKETPILTELEPFLEGDPFTKVIRHDQWNTMRLFETPSGTSCPPQPQLKSIRKPLVLSKLELFLGGFYKSCQT